MGTLFIDGFLTLLWKTLTSAMSNLEDSDNEGIYLVINFLYVYQKRDKYKSRFSQSEYQELERFYEFYRDIIQKIKVDSPNYIPPNLNLNNTNKITQHANTISIFNQLSDTQQKSIINLAEFLVYCKQNNSEKPVLKQYEDLRESLIKCSIF